MKLRHPWLIAAAAALAAGVIRAWMAAVRRRVAHLGPERHPADPKAERYVYALWQESLLFLAKFRAPASVLISQHADGELVARVCRRLGAGVVRGSTTRGGSSALLELVRRSRQTHLVITPDGPRGPRRRAQSGVVSLASLTGLAVVPVGIACTRGWRAGSWDRLLVPRPGTAAHFVAGPVIRVPAGLDRAALEEYRRLVEAGLHGVTDAAERWAAGGPRPAPDPARRLPASA